MCRVLYVLAYKLCAFCSQGDYRQLVHELDENQYNEIRLVMLEILNSYVRHLHPVVCVEKLENSPSSHVSSDC